MIESMFVSVVAHAMSSLVPAATGGFPWIDEPDVSLTDYALALETALFALLLASRPARWVALRRWSVAFFASAAIASFAGGTDHGFFRVDGRETGHDVFWTTSLLAIGATALTLTGMGAELLPGRLAARAIRAVAAVAGAAYVAVVLFLWRDFLVAILAYAPAALFLLGALAWRRARGFPVGTARGIAAVVLAFVAAAVQQLGIGVHPDLFNHNALYHLIQGVSFWLLYVSLREITS